MKPDGECIDCDIEQLRIYVRGCIGRARWHRDEGRVLDNSHDAAVREVKQARRYSQKLRQILHRTERAVPA